MNVKIILILKIGPLQAINIFLLKQFKDKGCIYYVYGSIDPPIDRIQQEAEKEADEEEAKDEEEKPKTKRRSQRRRGEASEADRRKPKKKPTTKKKPNKQKEADTDNEDK